MADNILEELKAYEAPKRLPPIADKAAAAYQAANYKLDDVAAETIRTELNKHAGDLKALTDAIIGLGAFAIWVRDERGDNAAAEKVARIIGEHAPKYFPIGQRIVGALQDMALKASDLFDQFSGGSEEKKRAPKFGEDSPPGTLPLKALKPVNAPPPRPVRPKKKPTK